MKILEKQAFTLMELIVVIIIIAVLAAIAVPQYKKATLKSRFSTLMPMAKSIADAQEVYYQGRQFYALDVDELDVTPVDAENTTVTLSDEDNFNYVIAQRSDVPGNRYIMYQKHSENFPGNVHCEALTGDTQAEQLCQALGGENIGENGSYTAYLLSGNSAGGTFDKECKSTPETEQACSSGCGTTTREAECDTRTGEWTYGEWGACPGKPAESQECSANNKNGTQTRSVTCNAEGTAWETGSWSSCDIPCDNSTKPVNRTAAKTGATGTASCVEGEWVYQWEGGREYKGDSSDSKTCTPSTAYKCAGGTFSGTATGCSTNSSSIPYGCTGGNFTGQNSSCYGMGASVCMNSTFTGLYSYCQAFFVDGCAGSTFGPGAYCDATYEGGCNGTTYTAGVAADGTNTRGCCYSTQNYCPVGSPKCIDQGYVHSYMREYGRMRIWNGKCWGKGGTEVDCED